MAFLNSLKQPQPASPLGMNRVSVQYISRRHHHKHRHPAHQRLHEALDWTRTHLTAIEHIPTHAPAHIFQSQLVDSDSSKPSLIFAQPTTPAMGSPVDQLHSHVMSVGRMEIAMLAGGTAVLVFLLFIIMFLGVRGNQDVYDNKVGVAATLRRRRFFYERWRVPSLSECAELSRRGSEALFRTRSNSVASTSGFEFPVFDRAPQETEAMAYEKESWWQETTHEIALRTRTATPHPEELFVAPTHDLNPETTVRSAHAKSVFEEDSGSEDEGPLVIKPQPTRRNIMQRIAEWEAQEVGKYERLFARAREEQMARLRRREVEGRSCSRARSVSRGRCHSKARLASRKVAVSGVLWETDVVRKW